jgi:biotin-(acetyl-CoA carboxylase) ligase
MDNTILIVLIILLVVIIGLIYTNNNPKNIKSKAVKKQEIIDQYINNLQKILKRFENNKEEQISQKKLYMIKVRSELSRNIFFTPEESKEVLERLAKL